MDYIIVLILTLVNKLASICFLAPPRRSRIDGVSTAHFNTIVPYIQDHCPLTSSMWDMG